MIWHMEILKIYLEEQRLINYYVIKQHYVTLIKIKKEVDHKTDLASMVYNFFDKTTLRRAFKSEVMPNQQLAEELHEPIITKCEKRKVYSSFINNILRVDLADMELIKNFNKGFRFHCVLLTVIVNMRVLFP